MKTLEFNSSSWHFKLAEFGGYMINFDEDSICTYIQHVLRGLVGILVITFAGSFLTFIVGSGIFHWVGVMLGFIHRPQTGYEGAGTFFLVCIGVLFVVFSVKIKYGQFKKSKSQSQPNFISEAYRSLKDKTCIRIKFKGNS